MTEIATQLLATFNLLSPKEQHEILAQILRKTGDLAEAQFTDACTVSMADQLFQTLDAEELNGESAQAR